MNFSSRLSDYYTNSYLKYQSTLPGGAGSLISAAILKYGLSAFSLQVIELGPSPTRDAVSVNSDFILLEQYFLDRYILIYNIRRIALGPAPVLNPNYDYNKGNTNAQFGKKGPEGAA
jgi:hypothetical protein